MEQQGKPPIVEYSAGNIRASIWRNQTERNGRTFWTFSVKIEKRFHDEKTDQWRTTNQFFARDLPRLALLAIRAFAYIVMRESENGPDLPPVAR